MRRSRSPPASSSSAHLPSSLPPSLPLSLLLFSFILSSFASVCTIAVPPDRDKYLIVSSLARGGGVTSSSSSPSNPIEHPWTIDNNKQDSRVYGRHDNEEDDNDDAVRRLDHRKLATHSFGRELTRHLQALEHLRNVSRRLTEAKGEIEFKLFFEEEERNGGFGYEEEEDENADVVAYRYVQPIFGRDSDYDDYYPITSGEDFFGGGGGGGGGGTPDDEDGNEAAGNAENSELLRKLTLRLRRLQRRIFKTIRETATTTREERISARTAQRMWMHDLDACQAGIRLRNDVVKTMAANFSLVTSFMRRISEENAAIRKQSVEKEAQVSKLFTQVDSLKREKAKLERKMSEKNKEIISLTYNHENNKMRIRLESELEHQNQIIRSLRSTNADLNKRIHDLLVGKNVPACQETTKKNTVDLSITNGKITPITVKPIPTKEAQDCSRINKFGIFVVEIGEHNVTLVCEKGWTVLQRRGGGGGGGLDFDRGWGEYKRGFGDLQGEFWLGNDNIHLLTKQGNYRLMVELEDWSSQEKYYTYDFFRVANESEGFKLTVIKELQSKSKTHASGRIGGSSGGGAGGGGSGGVNPAGDSKKNAAIEDIFEMDGFEAQSQMKFSTRDVDNDFDALENCARATTGGWWFRNCQDRVNLNGGYFPGGSAPYGKGIIWYDWKRDFHYSLKSATMKIKPYVVDYGYGLESGKKSIGNHHHSGGRPRKHPRNRQRGRRRKET